MTDMDNASIEFFRARALYYMGDKPVPDPVPEVAVFVEDDSAPAPFTQAELPQTVGADRIKLIARARILAVLPEWKQVNMTARSVELTRAGMAGNLTDVELAEEAAILQAWGWVKSVRAYSDTLEAAYEAAEDKAGFDYLTGWPEFNAAETPMPIGEMEIPEEIEIPRFLAPDPLEDVPAGLLDLAEPGETALEMQARLWSLWLELNGKLMLGLATTDETALHSRLHNELHWFAPPIEGET